MSELYYTPSIEEFHVGFEYEYKNHDGTVKDLSQIEWKKDIVDSLNKLPYIERGLCIKGNTRVKYLDNQDIEELGWKFDLNITTKTNRYCLNKEITVKLLHGKEWNKIRIFSHDIGIFSGTIKNKSELRKLMQQLNIQ